jgi:hypothetical protein
MFRKLTQDREDRQAQAAAMSRDEFWRIVEGLNDEASAPPDKEVLLRSWLAKADPATLRVFDDHLQDLVDAAYRWPLWAAAHILHGDCADDCFTHFRGCLVFMGRAVYDAACADPDTLSQLDDRVLRGLFHEGLLYVAMDVYEETTGGVIERSKPSPVIPTGEPCDETDPEELAARCPDLWRRFGR